MNKDNMSYNELIDYCNYLELRYDKLISESYLLNYKIYNLNKQINIFCDTFNEYLSLSDDKSISGYQVDILNSFLQDLIDECKNN